MKHVLLITYYFPPYTGIEGNRLNSWASALRKSGFRVTVISRQWKKGAQSNWEDYYREHSETDAHEEPLDEGLTVIRLPYRWSPAFRRFRGRFGGLYYWTNKVVGVLHPETNADYAFREYAMQFIRRERPEFLVVSSPPLNIIRLGHFLKSAFPSMKFIADFRDSYNNDLIQERPRLRLKEKVEAFLFRTHLRRWLRNADCVVSVSTPILETIRKRFHCPTIIVTNGFEEDLFRDVPLHPNGNQFTLSMVGSLYPRQDIGFMCRAIDLFIRQAGDPNIKVQFIGIRGRKNIVNEIRKHIDDRFLHFTDRIERQKALEIMKNSHILLQVGWRGYRGLCPGKVFEYLGAGRNILVAPADGDLTDRVIGETGAGFSAPTIENAAGFLLSKYREWKEHGVLSYSGNPSAISRYTRESQNRKLEEFLRGM